MTTYRPYMGPNRDGRLNDGDSRPFEDGSTEPRQVIAEVLARRDGWAEIRPGHWAEAGAVVKELKVRGMLAGKRAAAEQRRAKE